MLGRQPLLINAMPGFVQDAEERFVEVMHVVARGDAAIAGADTTAKRVSCHIQPAGLKIEPDGGGGCLTELLLLLNGISSFEKITAWPALRGEDRRYQRHEIVSQRGKELANLRRRGARLILIEQGIVRRSLIANCLRFLAQ